MVKVLSSEYVWLYYYGNLFTNIIIHDIMNYEYTTVTMRYDHNFARLAQNAIFDNHPITVVHLTSTYSPSSALILTQPPPISVSLSSEALPINDQQFTGIHVHVHVRAIV